MATKQLKDVYGEGHTRTVINRAIRAEIPGGDELLDLMESRPHPADLFAIRQAMENEIRKRYGMNVQPGDELS